MEIENNNYRPAFGARFVTGIPKIHVKKLNSNGEYKKTPAHFVELLPNCMGDILALSETVKSWKNEKFASSVFASMLKKMKGNPLYTNRKIYAITTQNKNINKLDSKQILGVTEGIVNKNYDVYLEALQVNPNYVYAEKPEYKGVGTAILKSLKNIYYKIQLISASEKYVKDFYKKNEFIDLPRGSNFFVWHKNLF